MLQVSGLQRQLEDAGRSVAQSQAALKRSTDELIAAQLHGKQLVSGVCGALLTVWVPSTELGCHVGQARLCCGSTGLMRLSNHGSKL